jgi:hypothetical protein
MTGLAGVTLFRDQCGGARIARRLVGAGDARRHRQRERLADHVADIDVDAVEEAEIELFVFFELDLDRIFALDGRRLRAAVEQVDLGGDRERGVFATALAREDRGSVQRAGELDLVAFVHDEQVAGDRGRLGLERGASGGDHPRGVRIDVDGEAILGDVLDTDAQADLAVVRRGRGSRTAHLAGDGPSGKRARARRAVVCSGAMWTPWIAVLLLACGPDPTNVAARTYADSLQPLLDENGLLALHLLDAAADVHDAKATSEQTRVTWETDIVPLAEHLRDQALIVDAPPDWAADHKGLTDIWTARADAYREISEAIAQGDGELWKRGREEADTAKLAEETWFQRANERLGPAGVTLDQFP